MDEAEMHLIIDMNDMLDNINRLLADKKKDDESELLAAKELILKKLFDLGVR